MNFFKLLGTVHKIRPQSGREGLSSVASKGGGGGGAFRCRRPHFLAQKFRFSKFRCVLSLWRCYPTPRKDGGAKELRGDET